MDIKDLIGSYAWTTQDMLCDGEFQSLDEFQFDTEKEALDYALEFFNEECNCVDLENCGSVLIFKLVGAYTPVQEKLRLVPVDEKKGRK